MVVAIFRVSNLIASTPSETARNLYLIYARQPAAYLLLPLLPLLLLLLLVHDDDIIPIHLQPILLELSELV